MEDFDAETKPWSFDHHWFIIHADGPTLLPKSNIIFKQPIWGLYSAIWYISYHSLYRELTFKLLDEGSLVGHIRFVKTQSPTLGGNNYISTDANSLSTVLPKTKSTLPGTTATDVTSSSALGAIFHNGRCTAEIDMAGQSLLVADVFMTIYTALVELAPSPRTQVFQALHVRANYNIWLRIENSAISPPGRSLYVTNGGVNWALGRVAVAMFRDNNNWREMQMTIKVDDTLLGSGSMVAASPAPLVLASAYNSNVTTL